jgi:hypothetical protein
MYSGYHLDEAVNLLSRKTATNNANVDTLVPAASMSLQEAARVVVEDWGKDRARQLSAVILRDSGQAIQRLDEIRAIYALTHRSPTG